jgi:uncharacterized RDD family membrane protein YckC
MTAIPQQVPQAAETAQISGFWRRVAAFMIDLMILGLPLLLLGLLMFRWLAGLGQTGRSIGFVVALLYFGLLNSSLGGGQTIGKRLQGIRVVDRSGATLSPVRSIVRFLVIGIPYFLNGLWFDTDAFSVEPPAYLLGVLLDFVVLGGLGATAYLYVFNRRTRQSLHDLAVGSFVVRDPGVPIPTGFAIPRLHLIVTALLVLALTGPAIALRTVYKTDLLESLTPGAELESAIKRQLGLLQVNVSIGSTTTTGMRTGASTTSYLEVSAQAGATPQDDDALMLSIARMVLDRHPDLLGKQTLIVRVSRSFDLGIASWSINRREALDAAAWQAKLKEVR